MRGKLRLRQSSLADVNTLNRRSGLASLPSEIQRDAGRRLATAAWVWIGLWSLGLVMNNIVGPWLSPERPLDDAWPWPGNPAALGCILVSVAVIFATRRASLSLARLLDLALVYEVVLAFAIGLVNQWTPNTAGLSWICALLLVHPLLVPNTVLRTVVASLLAAAMDLVGLAITGARGVPLPPGEVILWTYLPNFICAFLAMLPAKVVARLSREVTAARELGSYKLGELLRKGGMGEVYREEHRLLARPAAIKLVRPELLGVPLAERQQVLRRFEREAQATARLRSAHTIAVYDYGIADDGTFYYVMELLDGFDLDTFVRRFGPVPAARAVHFLTQVCDSLAEAHENELIHRDIKPANVFACHYGRTFDVVKVLDFGLVKPARPADGITSATDAIGGTPGFMAPEQVLGMQPVDARTDLYAVGCLAYWLLTGQLVFDGASAVDVIAQHARTPPTPPSQRTELPIPSALDSLILSCLEKEPARRPQSADDLLDSLRRCGVEPWTEAQGRSWWQALVPESARSSVPPRKWLQEQR